VTGEPVRVAGVGMTKFGKSSDRTGRELFAEASRKALEDAGVSTDDVEELFFGNFMSEFAELQGHQGPMAAAAAGITAPSVRVDSACASSGVAVRQGITRLRAGDADVVLVGGSERAPKYRHYTPTNARLGEYALVSVTTQRDGLHASATRTVAFESEMDDADLNDLGDRHHAARIVETTALGATRAIADLSADPESVFQAIQAAYEHLGHADEWQKHHQGGAAGFAGREWFAAPEVEASAKITTPMAYAYNPTIQGAKSEDTVLVTADGFEVLTDTGQWPTTAVDAYDYDAVIERPDVLVQEDDG